MEATEKGDFLNNSNSVSRSPSVDIEFKDLNYCLKKKRILNSINGTFCSGELTGILGSSGSGKTTLLKILAGYILDGVTGEININGAARQMKNFHKMSAYIMQDDLLQPHLTLHESITVVARLKLGGHISYQKKKVIINEILTLFGLENSLETRMEHLSGGEKKRLSIALEMINNPPVILLDEPTSGLDTVAVKQCISVLRTLTGQGRTIICAIHQPSPTILQQFDQVYFVTNGSCIYNGSPTNMIPFLSSVGLECPTTHSPAEYIIETAQLDDKCLTYLIDGIQNGKINKRESQTTIISSDHYENNMILEKENRNFPTSFCVQFYIILGRMMLQLRRNVTAICIQLFSHLLVAILLGLLNLSIGKNAEMALSIFKFCMVINFFFMYSHLFTLVLLYPLEVQIVKREYFNRWYSLKAYFLAMTVRSLPLMIILGLIFLVITYLMTDQPLELQRFIQVSVVCILVAVCSESLGLAVGSIFSITNGSIVALGITGPSAFFCIYGMGYGEDVGPVMKFILSINYLRSGLAAIMQAIFENREPLECKEIYCYYAYPKRLLKDLGMLDKSYGYHILVLTVSYLLFRLIAFFAIRHRLTSNIMN